MTLTEYQAWTHSTAIYEREEWEEYLTSALLAEVGEVNSLLAKSIRDKTPIDREKICLELGDVYWVLCETCTRLNVFLDVDDKHVYELRKELAIGPINRLFRFMMGEAISISVSINDRKYKRFYLNPDYIRYSAEMILSIIMLIAEEYGLTPDEIRDANKAKLTDRQVRGVLKGSGDYR